MKKLRAADSADAIVDGLLRRRAAVYVPSSLRPLSVLTSRCRAASSASSSARSAATRSPKSSTPRLARTTRRRRGGRCPSWWPKRSPTTRPPSGASAASRSQTPTSAASFSNSTHAAAPSSSSLPTRADSSSRDPQGTDNERAAPNRYETKRPGERPPDARMDENQWLGLTATSRRSRRLGPKARPRSSFRCRTAARLLSSCGRLGRRHRFGDNSITPTGDSARVLCHELDGATQAAPTIAFG